MGSGARKVSDRTGAGEHRAKKACHSTNPRDSLAPLNMAPYNMANLVAQNTCQFAFAIQRGQKPPVNEDIAIPRGKGIEVGVINDVEVVLTLDVVGFDEPRSNGAHIGIPLGVIIKPALALHFFV